MLTEFPPDYDDETVYTRSGNCEVYRNRGWCFCESSWAQLVKPSRIVWDLAKLGEVQRNDIRPLMSSRIPPVLPDNFTEQLELKGFTNGSTDRPLVAGLYRDAFEQRFAKAEELDFGVLEWGDTEAQALAEVLGSGVVPRLRSLDLGSNKKIGCEGVAALARALPQLPALEEINLYDNSIGDAGVQALAGVLSSDAAPRLRVLDLGCNSAF